MESQIHIHVITNQNVPYIFKELLKFLFSNREIFLNKKNEDGKNRGQWKLNKAKI